MHFAWLHAHRTMASQLDWLDNIILGYQLSSLNLQLVFKLDNIIISTKYSR